MMQIFCLLRSGKGNIREFFNALMENTYDFFDRNKEKAHKFTWKFYT